MRRLVFADEAARSGLEAILHPLIRERMEQRLAQADAIYAIAMIPLLLETGQAKRFHRVLVVDAPREAQIRRARTRDGSSQDTLEGILAAQMDRDTRLARADDIIHNDGGIDDLKAQVEHLHERYLAEAARLRADRHQ
jgi:dephospho-CoA kinase